MQWVWKPVDPSQLQPLRQLHRQEMNCQIVYDAWSLGEYAQGFAAIEGSSIVGYVAVARKYDPGAVIEFYLLPELRDHLRQIFVQALPIIGATSIIAQTNDQLLSALLKDLSGEIKSASRLFEYAGITQLMPVQGAVFRALDEQDRAGLFEHRHEPVGTHGLVVDGQVVATGGAFHKYNPPYADVYMEVMPEARRQGHGGYLVQEVCRQQIAQGYTPSARCNIENEASRRTLLKAGFRVCGLMQVGALFPG